MLLDEIADHLQTNGFGTIGVDLFKSYLPDKPDLATVIYEYPGRASDKAFGTTNLIENPHFQITVRSAVNGYAAARTKAQGMFALLDGSGGLTLLGQVYLYIEALGPPFSMERDDNERDLIACNFEAQRKIS